MKISQMSTDQAADVLVRIAQPAANIMDDDDVSIILKDLSKMKTESVPYIKLFAGMIPRVVPLALKTHRDDLYEIIGAFADMPTSEVGKLNIKQTISVLKDSIDQELIDFFESIGGQGKTAEAESSSVCSNTAGTV